MGISRAGSKIGKKGGSVINYPEFTYKFKITNFGSNTSANSFDLAVNSGIETIFNFDFGDAINYKLLLFDYFWVHQSYNWTTGGLIFGLRVRDDGTPSLLNATINAIEGNSQCDEENDNIVKNGNIDFGFQKNRPYFEGSLDNTSKTLQILLGVFNRPTFIEECKSFGNASGIVNFSREPKEIIPTSGNRKISIKRLA